VPPELVYEIDGQRVSYSLTGEEATIGRSADNDVVIRNALISRHHARVFRVGHAWQVTDLGSANGTRVNDADPTDRDLRSGDRIGLHKFRILFVDPTASSVSLISDTGPAKIDRITVPDAGRPSIFPHWPGCRQPTQARGSSKSTAWDASWRS